MISILEEYKMPCLQGTYNLVAETYKLIGNEKSGHDVKVSGQDFSFGFLLNLASQYSIWYLALSDSQYI